MPVTVYSKPFCPQCMMTKKTLEKYRIPYETVDVTQDKDAYDYVVGLGYKEAPVVVVDEGTHWGGFRAERIKELIST